MNVAVSGSIYIASAGLALGAGFTNLQLDDGKTNTADLIAAPFGGLTGTGPIADLLPGWTVTHGETVLTRLSFNKDEHELDFASLYDELGFMFSTYFAVRPEGQYAIYFQFSHSTPYSISQFAEVPTKARFLAYQVVGSPFSAKIDDEVLQPLPPGNYSYSLDARFLLFDVARFAGKSVTLSLTQVGTPDGYTWLDTIQFLADSPQLSVTRAGTNAVIAWPESFKGYHLQTKELNSPTGTWEIIAGGFENRVTVPVQSGNKVFRLGLGSGR